MASGTAHYDLARYGKTFRRLVSRPHDRRRPSEPKMAPVLRQVYDQMMEPSGISMV